MGVNLLAAPQFTSVQFSSVDEPAASCSALLWSLLCCASLCFSLPCANVHWIEAAFYFNFFLQRLLCIFARSAPFRFIFCYIFRWRWRLSCCVSHGQSVVELKFMAARLTGAEKRAQKPAPGYACPLLCPLLFVFYSAVQFSVYIISVIYSRL